MKVFVAINWTTRQHFICKSKKKMSEFLGISEYHLKNLIGANTYYCGYQVTHTVVVGHDKRGVSF